MYKFKASLKHLMICLVAVLCVTMVVAGFSYTYAYFTSRHDVSSNNMSLATLTLDIQKSGSSLTTSQLASYLTDKLPGDTISLDGTKVKNVGEADCYVLVYVNFTIAKAGQPTIRQRKWFNLAGEEVNSNITSNTTQASLLAKNAAQDINASIVLDGQTFGNEYQSATISCSVRACAVQKDNLVVPEGYANQAHYAAYLIYQMVVNPV